MAKMSAMRHFALLVLVFLSAAVQADVSKCACDPARKETLEARECSLCSEAEKQSSETEVFFLRDINPRKPNRWLALPRAHHSGFHALRQLAAAERTQPW